LWIERRAAVEVDDAAAQAELRHLDRVVGAGELRGLPVAALRMKLY
jgi:hypothetical protein